jgi:hypothetical protein
MRTANVTAGQNRQIVAQTGNATPTPTFVSNAHVKRPAQIKAAPAKTGIVVQIRKLPTSPPPPTAPKPQAKSSSTQQGTTQMNVVYQSAPPRPLVSSQSVPAISSPPVQRRQIAQSEEPTVGVRQPVGSNVAAQAAAPEPRNLPRSQGVPAASAPIPVASQQGFQQYSAPNSSTNAATASAQLSSRPLVTPANPSPTLPYQQQSQTRALPNAAEATMASSPPQQQQQISAHTTSPPTSPRVKIVTLPKLKKAVSQPLPTNHGTITRKEPSVNVGSTPSTGDIPADFAFDTFKLPETPEQLRQIPQPSHNKSVPERRVVRHVPLNSSGEMGIYNPDSIYPPDPDVSPGFGRRVLNSSEGPPQPQESPPQPKHKETQVSGPPVGGPTSPRARKNAGLDRSAVMGAGMHRVLSDPSVS